METASKDIARKALWMSFLVPPPESASQAERRQRKRLAESERSTAVIADRKVACLITDRSQAGLRLLFSGHVNLADQFDLCVGPGGTTRGVELVWTDGHQAGVAFRL